MVLVGCVGLWCIMVDYGGFGLQHHEQSSITRHMANKIDKNRLGLDLPTVTQQQHAAKCSKMQQRNQKL